MSLISTLHTSSSALSAFSKAIDIEGQNVANAATPGYAALRTSIQPIGPAGASGGADYILISSAGDLHADAQVHAASSDAAWSQGRSDAIEPLGTVFNITGDAGLLGALHRFSAAFADLAVTPNDSILRSTALASVGAVAAAFRKAAADIDSRKSQIDAAVSGVALEINRLSRQVRDANVQLRRTGQPDAGQEAIRRNALDQLSSLIDITVFAAPDGSVTVLAGGQQPLVIADQVYELSVDLSSLPEDQVSTAGGGLSRGAYGGKLGALLDVRNNVIGGLTGNASGSGALNELAKGFSSRVNSLLSSGITAGGQPGRPVLIWDSASDANAARSLTLDNSVLPGELALATPGPPVQANGIANALARLFNSSNSDDWISGASVETLYSSIATGVGQSLSTAREQATAARSVLTSAAANREEQSGVSLDESAIAITSLQRYYQASAKLVSILDTLTTTEINLIR